jgi:branched-chain amino acid transport system ATP-binding protein
VTCACDQGSVHFDGRDVTNLKPHQRCRLGIGRSYQVPQPFGHMTVFENLVTAACFGGGAVRAGGGADGGHGARADRPSHARQQAGWRAHAPQPQAPRAGTRASRRGPKLLLLDEIAGGLTEHEASELVGELKRIKAAGVTMVWIEHVVHALLALADRLFVINFGCRLAEGEPRAGDGRSRGAPRLHGDGGVTLLATHGLSARYGDAQALFGIDFGSSPERWWPIIGANGAGKSTFMKALTGLVRAPREQVTFEDEPIGGLPPAEIVRRGIALVPEGRRLFPEPFGRGEPAHGRDREACRAVASRTGLCAVPDPARQALPAVDLALGRTAADGRDRARVDGQPEGPAVRRAEPRLGTGRHQEIYAAYPRSAPKA